MLTVILVEPETPGNIGSVARAMKNFGQKKLVLVNPKCDYLDGEAYGRAMHARDLLKKATVVKKLKELKFDYLVATTAALGSDYNVVRSPITPGQLASQLRQQCGAFNSRVTSVALVFGRESGGLTTDEISHCDLLVTIPAAKKYGTLNLSHAVTILLYELFQHSTASKNSSHIPLASRNEKNIAMRMVGDILASMDFAFDSKKETQSLVWSRLINKAFLTRREMYALLGFLRKVSERMKK